MKRAVIVLAALGALALPGAAQAQAQMPARQAVHHWTINVGKTVNTSPFKIHVGRTHLVSVAGAKRCWRKQISATANSLVINGLFRWSQIGNWCGAHGVIVSPSSVVNQPAIPSGLSIWAYKGPAFSFRGGGLGQPHFYRRNGGTFEACIVRLACFQKIPWVAMTLRADGSAAWDWGW